MNGAWATRAARWVAWAALLAGVGVAIALWILAPRTVTTTETIVGHAMVTFEGVETRIRAAYVVGGVAALVGGLTAWIGLLLLARIAERSDGAAGP